MKIIEIEQPIFELIFSESIKEMCLFENNDELLTYIDENIDSEDLLNDQVYEILVPYFEGNIIKFVGVPEDLLAEVDIKEKAAYYSNLAKQKLNPQSLLKLTQNGARKASLMAKKSLIGKAIVAGLVGAKQEWKKNKTK